MAEQRVAIRSVKQYFNEFISQPFNGQKLRDADIIDAKAKILKAFQQELYGRIILKLGPEAAEMKPDDLADIDSVKTILQDVFRRWRRLCILCSEQGFGNYFHLEDLKEALKDGPTTVSTPDVEEDVTDKLDDILPPGEKPVILNGGVQIVDKIPSETDNEVENGETAKETEDA